MQLTPSGGQICNLCNQHHLLAKFATNASGAIWWPILQLMLVRGEYFSEKPIFLHIPQKLPCTGIGFNPGTPCNIPARSPKKAIFCTK